MARRTGKVTIHDIAYELGLNASTVSRALADNPVVSAKTRALVQAKAEELNYQPNRMAAALRKGRSDIIGVVVPAIDRAFFSSVIRGIEDRAEEDGCHIIVCQSYDSFERERTMVETLRRLQADGIIVSTAKDSAADAAYYRRLIEEGAALQFFDVMPPGLEASAILSDDEAGGYLATKHLIDQGYRRIAHLRGPQYLHIYRDRYQGYRRALEEAGLAMREDYVVDIESHFDSGEDAFPLLWSVKEKPDAIFSASDFSAAGCMKAAHKLGLDVPRDLAFVGYANEPFATVISPELTTIGQQTQEMGRLAAHQLLTSLGQEEEVDIQRLSLAPNLLIRESSPRKN